MATTSLPVTGRGFDNKPWRLVDERTGEAVNVGDRRTDSRGKTARISGGSPPHKSGASGYIWVRIGGASMDAQYYASVYGARWIPA